MLALTLESRVEQAQLLRPSALDGSGSMSMHRLTQTVGKPPSAVIRPLSAVAKECADGRLGIKIIDFAHAHNGAQATQVYEELSYESKTSLTLTDCVVIAYVLASVAFYSALVWFLTSY
jgi:hypothetical protein